MSLFGLDHQHLDLMEDVLRARQGDQAAARRALRGGLPLAADLLIRPGAGSVVTRGLGLLDELRGERARTGGDVIDGVAREGAAPTLPSYTSFVQRLIRQRCGLYVAVGPQGSGKTTLILRLAQRIADAMGYSVHAVGGIHPDDRARWRTDEWIEYEAADHFVAAMPVISAAMLGHLDADDPRLRLLRRRVLLLDDASLHAHVGRVAANRALQQAYSVYRHVDWIICLSAVSFKTITTVAEDADVRFLKRPTREKDGRLTVEATERDETLRWWRAAEQAYAELRGTTDWRERPHERQWVYTQAPRLGYDGLVHYDGPRLSGDRPTAETDDEA